MKDYKFKAIYKNKEYDVGMINWAEPDGGNVMLIDIKQKNPEKVFIYVSKKLVSLKLDSIIEL